MRNIFLFLLVQLLKGIKGDEISEQNEIASEVDLENRNRQNETLIITVPLNPSKKSNFNEVRKSFVKQNKYDNTMMNKNKVAGAGVMTPRKSRNTVNGTNLYYEGIECLTCKGKEDGYSDSDFNCYSGRAKTQKCADFEQCFTELHPRYIRRGCISPMNLNRTFVCKCPLCNDKPSQDPTYYEYRSLSDWLYDSRRLEKPVTGLDLLCKYCETRGVNPDDDNSCRAGRNTDYTICGPNQLCFTNIDSEINFVSRGCINIPAHNSIYFYCNHARCNDEKFDSPQEDFFYPDIDLRGWGLRDKEVELKSDFVKNKSSLRLLVTMIMLIYYLTNLNPNKEVLKSKNPLPYFRRQVEEIANDVPIKTVTEDSRGKLLSLLVENVKELFNDDKDESESKQYDNAVETTTKIIKPTILELAADDLISIEPPPKILKFGAKDLVTVEHTNDVMLYENLSVTAIDRGFEFENFNEIEMTESTSRKRMKEMAREMKYFEKSDGVIKEVTPLTSISSYVLEATDSIYVLKEDYNKTCISCNNVLNENCVEPKNKIVPSVTCQRENDLCYSTHTPFGIIDRGCFNVNHNLTTYVCSCNLCNYISIAEMPYIFSNKQSWIDNVIELSRTRNFRNSIFKDMSCLRCEVNTTIKTGDMVDSANCLEGNIGQLPTQDCHDHEICGVKAVRSDGYIWRGCITAPLYNYWWSFCDRDLCNHDLLVSVYDLDITV